jgi:hypothetical protein
LAYHGSLITPGLFDYVGTFFCCFPAISPAEQHIGTICKKEKYDDESNK